METRTPKLFSQTAPIVGNLFKRSKTLCQKVTEEFASGADNTLGKEIVEPLKEILEKEKLEKERDQIGQEIFENKEKYELIQSKILKLEEEKGELEEKIETKTIENEKKSTKGYVIIGILCFMLGIASTFIILTIVASKI